MKKGGSKRRALCLEVVFIGVSVAQINCIKEQQHSELTPPHPPAPTFSKTLKNIKPLKQKRNAVYYFKVSITLSNQCYIVGILLPKKAVAKRFDLLFRLQNAFLHRPQRKQASSTSCHLNLVNNFPKRKDIIFALLGGWVA